MNYSPSDTIVAVATPPGLGGVAIVRVSGPDSLPILRKIVRRNRGGSLEWSARHMYYVQVVDNRDSSSEQIIDRALAVYMPGPYSYTGEDVAEIQCHGGDVLARLIVDVCVSNGARLALPGEFTYRAFMAGKLDLSEAESVLSLIEAKSKSGVVLAANNLKGALSASIEKLRDGILDIIAQYEAEIDYGDEIETSDTSLVAGRCSEFLNEVEDLLHRASEGRTMAEGVETVLVGPPNAGKSTLWNALIGQNKALVTPYPGTTRDQLEDYVYVNNVLLHLIDTAGLHESGDPVERLGMEKTLEALSEAELCLVVLDAHSDIPSDFKLTLSELSTRVAKDPCFRVLAIMNKCDLGVKVTPKDLTDMWGIRDVCQTSLKFGDGLEEIKSKLGALCHSSLTSCDMAISLSQRQRESLQQVRAALLRLQEGIVKAVPCDCLLLDLHDCLQALNSLTGHDVSEDVLNRVFSKFCLGK